MLTAGLGVVMLLAGVGMMSTVLDSSFMLKNALGRMYGYREPGLLQERIVRNAPLAIVGVPVAILGFVIIFVSLARRNVAAVDKDFSKWRAQKLYQHLIYLNRDDPGVSGYPTEKSNASSSPFEKAEKGRYVDGEATSDKVAKKEHSNLLYT